MVEEKNVRISVQFPEVKLRASLKAVGEFMERLSISI